MSKILVIVEGEKTDVKLMRKLFDIYGISENHQLVSYNTNIYTLYHEMFEKSDPETVDLLQLLKERETDEEKKNIFNEYYSDSRALKEIRFSKVDSIDCDVKSYNDKIENIIDDIDCDILYLDPPYTQNQYGTLYHLLETLILNDEPEISKVTGSRKTAQMRSDWSKEYKANILFDKIMSKTKAKYVVLSYNNDGFMSKEFIEASMKRYGKTET